MESSRPVNESSYATGVIHSFQLLRKEWILFSVMICMGVALGATAAFVLKPVYRGEVVVLLTASRDRAGSIVDALAPLAGIASLAGVNVGENSDRDEALELLKSTAFAQRFIERHSLLPVLYASDWDPARKIWITDTPPTMGDAVKLFKRRVVSVVEDKRSSVVRIGVSSFERQLVAQLANAYLADANEELRSRARSEAQKSIDYLNRELAQTNAVGVQQAISRLLEIQINRIMLTNVYEDYAFKVIDPATIPDADKFVRPNRPLLITVGAMLGLLAAIVFVWLRRAVS